MNKEQYQDAINAIDEKAAKEKTSVSKGYVMANNPFSVGNVIAEGDVTIKIESIRMTFGMSSLPSCVYQGVKLKKNLEPFKSGESDRIYQSNNPHLVTQ